jgi:glycerol-3-phosphate O-acyltransferase
MVIEPKCPNGDCTNILMLYYFRNPINGVFFNESIVLAAMHSFGLEGSW